MTSLPGSNSYDTALSTLPESGRPQETRISSPEQVRNLVLAWIQSDRDGGRSAKRALVDGLIQGNPPYKRSALVNASRADATNVNWRTAEAYEDAATGAFYDIFSEAPTFATILLDAYANYKGMEPDKVPEWGGVITEEFHYLISDDKSWDSVVQNSQRDTVRFGAGPLIFQDDIDWRNRNVPFACLQVPEDASSDINQWETAALRIDYLAHQLYSFIRNPKAASDMGWDVEATRRAIINAAPVGQNGTLCTWEHAQQQLKQNSFSWSARSKVIQAVHFFAKEFPRDGDSSEGKISHAVLLLSPASTDPADKFLCKRLHRYDNWQQCIHPMYYSQGQGGKHYGVTGMGVKMYGAMETENRLMCNAVDKAFAPKIMFKPTTASGKQRMLPQRMGDYAILPEGYDMQQVAISSLVEEGLLVRQEISRLVSANLSSYRQNLEAPKQGNPITKAEVEVRAADQARLGKTQLNRYYEQLDWLYEEKYRRACNPGLTASDPGGKEALEFQAKCKRRGVPAGALLAYCSVKATRVVGQGSQFLRQQTLDFMLAIAGGLPEDGREHVIDDAIAARAGQYMVSRYNPKRDASKLASDQLAFATSQVADMKVGVPAIVTSSQNPVIYAQTFLQAGAQALESLAAANGSGSLEQAAQVLSFLQLIGPAIAAHLQRFASDPTRQGVHKALEQQLKQLASATDKLQQQVEQGFKQRQQAAQKQQQEQMEAGKEALAVARGQDPALVVGMAGVERKSQLDTAKASAQAGLKARKLETDLGLKTAGAVQDMTIKDALAAAEIRRKAAEAEAAASHNDDSD